MMGDGFICRSGKECDLKSRRERAGSIHLSRKPTGLMVEGADEKQGQRCWIAVGKEGQ